MADCEHIRCEVYDHCQFKEPPEMCPQGCGRTTEDPYGGRARATWGRCHDWTGAHRP
jgi:hypothetical protein